MASDNVCNSKLLYPKAHRILEAALAGGADKKLVASNLTLLLRVSQSKKVISDVICQNYDALMQPTEHLKMKLDLFLQMSLEANRAVRLATSLTAAQIGTIVQTLAWFETALGLPPADVSTLLRRNPCILQANLATLTANREALTAMFDDREIRNMWKRASHTLASPALPQAMQSVTSTLQALGFGNQQVHRVLVSRPNVLGYSPNALRSKILGLASALPTQRRDPADAVAGGGEFGSAGASIGPRNLSAGRSLLADKQPVNSSADVTAIAIAVSVVAREPRILELRPASISAVLDALQSCGFGPQQLNRLVARAPQLLAKSPGNLRGTMQVLLRLGYDHDQVVCFPTALSYSTDGRILPRHRYWQLHRGNNCGCSLSFLLAPSDAVFSQRLTGSRDAFSAWRHAQNSDCGVRTARAEETLHALHLPRTQLAEP